MEHSHVPEPLRSCSACGWTHKRPCHPCLYKTSKAPLLSAQLWRSLCRRSAQIRMALLGNYLIDGRWSPRWLVVWWPTFRSPAGRVYCTWCLELGSQRMPHPILGPIETCQMTSHEFLSDQHTGSKRLPYVRMDTLAFGVFSHPLSIPFRYRSKNRCRSSIYLGV